MIKPCFALTLVSACVLPLSAGAHESFLTPHIHLPHEHTHAHEPAEHREKSVVTELHSHPALSRFHITTGVRYTRFDIAGTDAHFWETGLGIAFAATHWLQLSAEGRYGWFDGDFVRADGWLPARAGIEVHFPLGDAWEVGMGFKTQFPGVEPLAVREWELSPEIEIRYDRGIWYLGAIAEMSWIVGAPEHEDAAHAVHEHEGEDPATHAAHTEIHDLIDPHGETEFVWQASAGLRLIGQRLTLEGRVTGNHVIDGETEARNYLRAGARMTYQVNDHAAVLLDGNIPVSDPQRNEWQTSIALRLSF